MVIYDGIILGAGHNSLVLQAYLGRAGMSTLCLERRAVAGGGLTTEEDPAHPGFLHNTHSFYHRALNRMPWYRDLELERRGAVYLEPELNVALILKNGDALEWWTDFERTAASFGRFSARDEATLRRWRDDFLPIVERILIPESQTPPEPPERRIARLERSAEGRLLLEVSALSPLEFVLRELEHPVVQAGLLFFNGLREVDLRCRGFGHHIAALLANPGKAQMCVGGSAALAQALVRAVTETGGEIQLQRTPQRILVEGGRVVGVQTADGEIHRARHFVVSGLNPQQTFLELLEEDQLPTEWRERARRYRYNLLAPLFGLYVNLEERPHYRAEERHPELEHAFMIILGLESFEQFPEIVRHHEAGTIPPPVMWGSCPTRFDPSQAPAGKHTAFLWEKLPYHLGGDPANWDSERERHGQAMLDAWSEYAPDLKASVRHWFARSPLDTERTFPNMQEGDLLVGAFTDGQVGYDRPFPGAGQYRALPKGLYLCGACCHPGGNITGLAGYNCAQVILDDLGALKRG
ncbi:MAG TPA: NAD(P)/FAD-dependent oxidoreductase [Bryobacteraceae bacterium]|nr:NAD(P)/FAD-dependent oxidoreductase [Bryobacteraceae bacterium]